MYNHRCIDFKYLSEPRPDAIRDTFYETGRHARVVSRNSFSPDRDKRHYMRTARSTKPRRLAIRRQLPGNRRKHLRWGLFNGPRDYNKNDTSKPIQSCLRSSTPLNRTPGNPTCHVATVPQKMIGSIVLALLLFCQSINAGRCLRANGTHDEISQAVQQHRPRRSLTFPNSSMLLVCNWLIDEIASLIEFDMLIVDCSQSVRLSYLILVMHGILLLKEENDQIISRDIQGGPKYMGQLRRG